jgi:hypothetical protein
MENRNPSILSSNNPTTFIMKYDPRNPEPDYNTLKVGLLGLGMAAVLVTLFLSVMIPLFHAVNMPMR